LGCAVEVHRVLVRWNQEGTRAWCDISKGLGQQTVKICF